MVKTSETTLFGSILVLVGIILLAVAFLREEKIKSYPNFTAVP